MKRVGIGELILVGNSQSENILEVEIKLYVLYRGCLIRQSRILAIHASISFLNNPRIYL